MTLNTVMMMSSTKGKEESGSSPVCGAGKRCRRLKSCMVGISSEAFGPRALSRARKRIHTSRLRGCWLSGNKWGSQGPWVHVRGPGWRLLMLLAVFGGDANQGAQGVGEVAEGGESLQVGQIHHSQAFGVKLVWMG